MPERKQAEILDRNSKLMSEIGAGISRHETRNDTEAEIARLSADPLLLHRYLQGSTALPEQWKPNSQWNLSTLQAIGSDASVSPGRMRLYLAVEARLAESLQPESFVATEEDVALAIDHFAGSRRKADANPEQPRDFITNSLDAHRTALLWAILVSISLVVAWIW
jgi:hypothetical protein